MYETENITHSSQKKPFHKTHLHFFLQTRNRKLVLMQLSVNTLNWRITNSLTVASAKFKHSAFNSTRAYCAPPNAIRKHVLSDHSR